MKVKDKVTLCKSLSYAPKISLRSQNIVVAILEYRSAVYIRYNVLNRYDPKIESST